MAVVLAPFGVQARMTTDGLCYDYLKPVRMSNYMWNSFRLIYKLYCMQLTQTRWGRDSMQ